MRKPLLVALCLLVLGMTAMAQNKIETKWHCAKATTEHKIDVGDEAGHNYSIAQGTCNATASAKGFAEKSGMYTEFLENRQASSTNHGRFTVAMDNGDKVFYAYEGMVPSDKKATNRWRIESGTGKQKGIKGAGTCTGTMNQDGSSDWTCTGTYSMAK